MNLILFGAPGSGKGTQSGVLVAEYAMRQISTGDLFRSASKSDSKVAQEIRSYLDRGALVPDEVVLKMVSEAIETSWTHGDLILDGFPRTVAQAEALENISEKMGISFEKAIFLEVPFEILLGRLTGRRTCSACGSVFHVMQNPPLKDGVCDKCGGVLTQRSDDTESVVGKRIQTFMDNTLPLKEYYAKKGKLEVLNGDRDPSLINRDILKILKKT